MVIGVDNDGVAFEIKGNLGSGKTLIKQSASVDEEVSTTVDVKKEIALAFAIRYLGFFTKATNLSSVVTLSLSSNVPLCVEYPIEEVVESGKEVCSSWRMQWKRDILQLHERSSSHSWKLTLF